MAFSASLANKKRSARFAPSGIGTSIQPATPSMAAPFLCLVIVVALGFASGAAGHGRSVSYSSWEFEDHAAVVTVRMKLLELSRLGPEALPPGSVPQLRPQNARDLPAEFLPRDLILIADEVACVAESTATRRPDDPGWARYQWRIRCPSDAGTIKIQTRILLDVAPSHIHFARVRLQPDRDRVRERVLTEASPVFLIRSPGTDTSGDSHEAQGSGFRDYLELGIRHILSGWDHLAFVFGLLLLASRLGDVARLITGFTIAHSLTLALAVQGLVVPRAAAVEAVIAFSVALVAIERGWIDHGRRLALPVAVLVGLVALGGAVMLGWASLPLVTIAGLLLFTACYFSLAATSSNPWLRVCLTFAFGLVHGFGFAGILVEMTLPTDRLVPALLGFNLGVEIGQVGVVLMLWPLLKLGSRLSSPGTARIATSLTTAGLCGLGIYWLALRVFGA
jgi:hypothetical protein